MIYALKIIKPCRQKEQSKNRTNRATPMTHPDGDGWTMNWILPAGQEHHLCTVWCIRKKPGRGFSFQSRVRQSAPLFEKVVFIGKQVWKSKFKYSKRIKKNVKKTSWKSITAWQSCHNTLSLHFLNGMNQEHNSLLNSFDTLAYCLHFLYPTERYTLKLSEAWVFIFPNHSFCQFFYTLLFCFKLQMQENLKINGKPQT